MIIRVFRAIVHDGKQEEFTEFFVNKAIPILKRQRGMLGVTVGKPMSCSPNEFLMVTTWADMKALEGFAGSAWQNAVIDPDEADLLKQTFAHHYEGMITEKETWSARGSGAHR
jgi:heme-degrading monooxygenase HmoA